MSAQPKAVGEVGQNEWEAADCYSYSGPGGGMIIFDRLNDEVFAVPIAESDLRTAARGSFKIPPTSAGGAHPLFLAVRALILKTPQARLRALSAALVASDSVESISNLAIDQFAFESHIGSAIAGKVAEGNFEFVRLFAQFVGVAFRTFETVSSLSSAQESEGTASRPSTFPTEIIALVSAIETAASACGGLPPEKGVVRRILSVTRPCYADPKAFSDLLIRAGFQWLTSSKRGPRGKVS